MSLLGYFDLRDIKKINLRGRTSLVFIPLGCEISNKLDNANKLKINKTTTAATRKVCGFS